MIILFKKVKDFIIIMDNLFKKFHININHKIDIISISFCKHIDH